MKRTAIAVAVFTVCYGKSHLQYEPETAMFLKLIGLHVVDRGYFGG